MTPQTVKTVREAAGFIGDSYNNDQDDILIMPDQIVYSIEDQNIMIGPRELFTSNPRLSFAKALSAFPKVYGEDHDMDLNVCFAKLVDAKTIDIGNYNNIGLPGFGYATAENGEHVHIPHFGRVVIEENVQLQNFVNIDRGVIGDTIIRKGCKIDSFVHIAHNCDIGENTLIVAHAIIGGSVKIGSNCYIGMGAMIRNKVTIGDGATIGMGAVVTKDVPAGETWYGNPARKMEVKP